MTEKNYRSLVKGISWRFVGTFDTFLISWFHTGNPLLGLKIGVSEFFTKIVLYYFHERIWLYFLKDKMYQHKFNFIKGVTWRIVGTIDTIILSWFISQNRDIGIKIGLTELATKIILFYVHERIWNRIQLGKNKSNL